MTKHRCKTSLLLSCHNNNRMVTPNNIHILSPVPYSFCICLLLVAISPGAYSASYNHFIIEAPLIPLTEIRHGGPARDGIPSIDNPKFISATNADFLKKNDRVLGIKTDTTARAYPVLILNWHEIVNDGNILISYCPLCGTGMAFESDNSNFGVSGLLYNSDMLLYDRDSQSLWSQILAMAISGPRKGQKLNMLAVENTSWENWLNLYPDTLVLSTQTGYARNYSRSPYGNYESSTDLYFPVSAQSRRYHPKEKIIGVQINGRYKAYPFSELDKSSRHIIEDEIAGEKIEIHFNSQHRSGSIKTDSGKTYPSLISYWFAWYAFHPQTDIYTFSRP